jgi:hypothetical protein
MASSKKTVFTPDPDFNDDTRRILLMLSDTPATVRHRLAHGAALA